MSQNEGTSFSRTSIVGLFAASGGAIGALLVLLGMVAFGMPQPQTAHAHFEASPLSSIPEVIVVIAVLGTIGGFVPAMVTGIVYALLPKSSQRLIVAPLLGAMVSGGYIAAVGHPELAPMYIFAGAGAALVCAAVARKFRIDAIGSRTPT